MYNQKPCMGIICFYDELQFILDHKKVFIWWLYTWKHVDSNSFIDGRHHMTNLIKLFGSANLIRISPSEKAISFSVRIFICKSIKKHILKVLVNDIILFKSTIKLLESYWAVS